MVNEKNQKLNQNQDKDAIIQQQNKKKAVSTGVFWPQHSLLWGKNWKTDEPSIRWISSGPLQTCSGGVRPL